MPWIIDPETGRRVWQADMGTGVFLNGQPWRSASPTVPRQVNTPVTSRSGVVTRLDMPGAGTVVAEGEGGVSPDEAMRRMDFERRANALESEALGSLTPAGGVSGQGGAGGTRPRASQRPSRAISEQFTPPSPQEQAERVAVRANEILVEQRAAIQAEESKRAASVQNITRMSLMGAGASREQAELGARIAAGGVLDAFSYKALQDLASQDIGRESVMGRRGRARADAREILLGVNTKLQAGVKVAQESLTGGEFANKEAYQQAVSDAVNGPNSQVDPQVRGIVAAQLAANPPESVVKDEAKRREYSLAAEDRKAREKQDQDAQIMAGLVAEGKTEEQAKMILSDPVWAPEIEKRRAAIVAPAAFAKAKQDSDNKKAVDENKVDWAIPGQTDRLVAAGVVNESQVKAVVGFAEVSLPATSGAQSVSVDGRQKAIDDAAAAIARGIPPEQAVNDAIAAGEEDGQIVLGDKAGRESVTAQIKRGVADKIKADASTVNSRRTVQEYAQESERIAKSVEGLTKPTMDEYGKLISEAAAPVKGDITKVDIRQLAVDQVLGEMLGDFGEDSDTFKSVHDAALSWYDGKNPSKQERFAPLNAALSETLTRYTIARDAKLGAVAEEKAIQEQVVKENASRGLLTVVERDDSGKTVYKTFSARDPQDLADYKAYQSAGADERAAIAARQKTRLDLREKGASFAAKQTDLMAQGLIVRRTAQTMPGTMTGYVETELPLPPRREEDWDDYMLYLRENTMGAPEAYAQLYQQAESMKEEWQTKKAKELVKMYPDLKESDAEKLMDVLASANEEWSTPLTEQVTRRERRMLTKVGATAGGGKAELKGKTRAEGRMNDTMFVPAAEIPKAADVPDKHTYNTAAEAEAAGKAGEIPDGAYVVVGGKIMRWTKE